MAEVFFPLSSVFDWWRYRRTVEAVMQDFDVDELKVKRVAETMSSYSLEEHIASVAPVRLREQIRQRISASVTTKLDRYLDLDAVRLLRGLVKRSDITLIAHGHRHFYSEVVSQSCLKMLANNGLRFVERLSSRGELISAIADKRFVGYYFDKDRSQLLAAAERTRKLKLGLLNFEEAPVEDEAPFKSLHSMKEVQAWLIEEGIFNVEDAAKRPEGETDADFTSESSNDDLDEEDLDIN